MRMIKVFGHCGTYCSFCGKIFNGKNTTGCFTLIGVFKKLATLNPENMPVNVISIDI
jgi:hypothetical protein